MLAAHGVMAVANLFNAGDDPETPGPTPDHSFAAGYPKHEGSGHSQSTPNTFAKHYMRSQNLNNFK